MPSMQLSDETPWAPWVQYLASHEIDAKRCSLLIFPFFCFEMRPTCRAAFSSSSILTCPVKGPLSLRSPAPQPAHATDDGNSREEEHSTASSCNRT